MPVRFDSFTLDRGTRQLVSAGKEVPLEPKAFELLDLLLTRRPKAVAKAHIHDRLWARTFVSESTLSSLIVDLRAALGDDARRSRYIRTVRGYGYAFCGNAVEVADEPETSLAGPRARLSLFWGAREIALVEGENVLGRVDEAVAWIEAPTVSRRHARILVSGTAATLEDLGSKNGTFLRGDRLTAPARLVDADEVRLGRVRMTFRVLAGTASTATDVDP